MRCQSWLSFLLVLSVFLIPRDAICSLRDRIRARVQQRIEEKTPPKGNYAFQRKSLEHQGRAREYLVYVPANLVSNKLASDKLASDKRYPVVLNFHGGMSWAEQQADFSQMNEVADEFGFIVVYPNGTGKLKTRVLTFNAGSCCAYARDEKVDDVGFVRELIEQLPKDFPVDPKHIYATGFSNGAMLSYRIAAELAPLIAGIAPVSGGMGVSGPVPKRPVPVIHFHGLKDENARFEGGRGANQHDKAAHKPISESIQFWVAANHCDPKPVVTVEKDHIVERYSPKPGAEGAPVVLIKFPEGGHTWPGGGEMPEKMNLGNQIKTFSASRYLWNFLKTY